MPEVKSVKVRTIPATKLPYSNEEITNTAKRKVAGYARVSSDHDDQFTSYEAQIDYYTNYIKSRDDWSFVEVYTDEGITGTSTKHRDGFKRMVADALSGKIDLIITKSVSRFARNTVDSLSTIRKLKEHGIECYFEKENIWTFDGKGELLITIMSSLAQEESRSISQNCTWGHRKKFADGRFSLAYSTFLGYDKGEDGRLVINEEQAKVIKYIYDLYLQGYSFLSIARHLTDKGIKTPSGKDTWHRNIVKSILTNEKYKGDALLQKNYVSDFLTKKLKVNHGEVPQYYVEGCHEAIIPPEKFDLVQHDIAKRGSKEYYHCEKHTFSSRIKCGECGSWYGPKVWHSNSKNRRVVWQCNHKYDHEQICTTPHLTAKEIQHAFIAATNKLLSSKKEVIKNGYEMTELLFNIKQLEIEHDELLKQAQNINDQIRNGIQENSTVALNQAEYQKNYDELTQQYNSLIEKAEKINSEINTMKQNRDSIKFFIKKLEKEPKELTEFSNITFNALVEFITVYSKEDIRVTFRNGQEVKVSIN